MLLLMSVYIPPGGEVSLPPERVAGGSFENI
jgi:hypothetical protein